jgi:hypothetical protein
MLLLEVYTRRLGGNSVAASDPVEEWQRLRSLYAEMGEIELLDLKESFDDLTETAQGLLRDELKKRQLWDLPTPPNVSPEERKAHSFEDLHLAGTIVRAYDTVKEAKLAAFVLELAQIEAAVVDGQASFDLRPPAVRVAPEDLERADALLAQPVSAEIRADFEATLHAPDSEVPACPRCTSNGVLLEGVEPVNQWLCEDCGHSWKDALATD